MIKVSWWMGVSVVLLMLMGGQGQAEEQVEPSGVEQITLAEGRSVPDVVDRLHRSIRERGLNVVATIDHGAAAKAAGLTLGPTVLVVFGNPRVGTPVMQNTPTAGLHLPLKALVYEDGAGRVQLAWTPPDVLAARLGLSRTDPVILKMGQLYGGLREELLAP